MENNQVDFSNTISENEIVVRHYLSCFIISLSFVIDDTKVTIYFDNPGCNVRRIPTENKIINEKYLNSQIKGAIEYIEETVIHEDCDIIREEIEKRFQCESTLNIKSIEMMYHFSSETEIQIAISFLFFVLKDSDISISIVFPQKGILLFKAQFNQLQLKILNIYLRLILVVILIVLLACPVFSKLNPRLYVLQ